MRVRILKPITGVLDGVSLGHLVPGLTYDLDESLAGYLVSTSAAEAVSRSESAVAESSDDAVTEHVMRGVTVRGSTMMNGNPREQHQGQDRPRRTRKRRR